MEFNVLSIPLVALVDSSSQGVEEVAYPIPSSLFSIKAATLLLRMAVRTVRLGFKFKREFYKLRFKKRNKNYFLFRKSKLTDKFIVLKRLRNKLFPFFLFKKNFRRRRRSLKLFLPLFLKYKGRKKVLKNFFFKFKKRRRFLFKKHFTLFLDILRLRGLRKRMINSFFKSLTKKKKK